MPGRAYRPSPHTEDGTLTPAVSKSFLPDEASPRSARLWAREALSLRADVDVDAVALLVSELATNARRSGSRWSASPNAAHGATVPGVA